MARQRLGPMFHHPFETENGKQRRAEPKARRRRLFGVREILLVAIAFTLLALLPTTAQFGWSKPVDVREPLSAVEKPEENFAGSAFYFLDPNDTAPAPSATPPADSSFAALDGALPSNASLAELQALPPSPTGAAQPFVIRAGTADHSRALKCLTDAIYYEAANEPDAGQRAVAQVIINRMRHPTYPNTICGVIYQGSERATGCQFSYSCDGSMARMPARPAWLRAQNVALQALAGYVYAPVGMATHYHATYVYPYWAPSLNYIGTIGAHRFYSWRGSAGRPSAFFSSYAGREPFPGPKPRAWTPNPAPSLDPIQLQKQYEREFAAARIKAEQEAIAAARATYQAPPPAPAYSGIAPVRQKEVPVYAPPNYSKSAAAKGGESAYRGGNLPTEGNIRPEFQSSGTWKKQPTG